MYATGVGRAVEAQARVNLYLWNFICFMVFVWIMWNRGVFSGGQAGRAGVLDHDEFGRFREFATFRDPGHEDSVFMKGLMVGVGGDDAKKVEACTFWNYFNPNRVQKKDYKECSIINRLMMQGCAEPETNYEKCFQGMKAVADALKISDVEPKDEVINAKMDPD